MKWADDNVWNFATLFGGPPDLIVKSPAYTQKAMAQDAWFKPVVETGLTEPRWVRAIEIRPGTVKGRKITHHALARLQQTENGEPRRAADAGSPAPAKIPVRASSWNGPLANRARSCVRTRAS